MSESVSESVSVLRRKCPKKLTIVDGKKTSTFFLLVHLYRAHSPVSRSFPNEHGRSSVTFLRPCFFCFFVFFIYLF